MARRIRGRMRYAPTLPGGRGISPSAFPLPKRMGFKNVLPDPQPARIGKSDPWAFPPLAGRIRGRMQYAPTLPEGRKSGHLAIPPLARRARRRMQYAPTHSAGRKSDPWAFPSLAGRARGRMQYAPTLPEGRGISPSAFLSPKRMGLKNVPLNPQPTRIGKSVPWAFPSLAERIRGRMQYAPTLLEGRGASPSAFLSPKRMGFKNVLPDPQPARIGKSAPSAFPSLAGRIRGRMQYAPTLPEGRGASPSAFLSPKRTGFKNVPPNP